MYVKPQHDHVPDPDRGGYLAPVGRQVEASPYWWRRVADGDVIEADPPPDSARVAESIPTESPPPAGSSVSEAPVPQPRTARKGLQQ